MTNIILLNLGYFLVFLAMSIREILWLQITITAGQSTLFTYSMLNGNYNIAFWNLMFIMVNVIQIIILYRERQELEIPDEIQDLYVSIFHTKSHREFLNFWDQGKICQVDKESLISSGDTQTDLMLILNGKADVVRNGETIAALERGQFIAEISYITGKPASADVVPQGRLTYYVWDHDTLDKLRKSKPVTMGKLDSILSLDMAGKLTR